jgi:hypothetical protein
MRTHKTITRCLGSSGDGNDDSGFHWEEEEHVMSGTTISRKELEGHCLIINLFGDHIFTFLNIRTLIQSTIASSSIGIWNLGIKGLIFFS